MRVLSYSYLHDFLPENPWVYHSLALKCIQLIQLQSLSSLSILRPIGVSTQLCDTLLIDRQGLVVTLEIRKTRLAESAFLIHEFLAIIKLSLSRFRGIRQFYILSPLEEGVIDLWRVDWLPSIVSLQVISKC